VISTTASFANVNRASDSNRSEAFRRFMPSHIAIAPVRIRIATEMIDYHPSFPGVAPDRYVAWCADYMVSTHTYNALDLHL